MPGEGCGAPAAPAAPRSSDPDAEDGGSDSDGRIEAGSRGGRTGRVTADRDGDADCDSNRNAGDRRGTSPRRSGIDVTPSESVANGHRGAHRHRHRDAPHGRRDSRTGDRGRQSIPSSASVLGDSGGLPLERLTQGKTGVVRLARPEPFRREAWSIFPQGMEPRVRTERGEGHRFEAKPVTQDWCDACSRKITAQALKCQSK